MVLFFKKADAGYIAVDADQKFGAQDLEKLTWLFSGAEFVDEKNIAGWFIGPRREMITPWSTNAVEITQNMALKGIRRIEEYFACKCSHLSKHNYRLQQ